MAIMISLLLAAISMAPPEGVIPDVTIYEDVQVWEDGGFSQRNLIVSGGRILSSVPEGAAVTRVALEGRYIVPAMANAHTHLTNASEEQSWAYLKEGVYYAWNPNLIQIPDWHAFMARPDTYEVKTSWGGMTEPGGHPEKLYTVNLREWVYTDRAEDSFLGDAFHYGRTEEEIVAALDLLTAQNADFVKMLLVFSEDYAERRDDPAYYGSKALNPENVPFLVAEAKKRGLPSYFHVESNFDLGVAARAGAQFAGHLPGYASGNRLADYAITLPTLSAMQAADMAAVPTYALARYGYDAAEEAGTLDPAARDAHYAVQAANLRLLQDGGVALLTGTDAAFHVRDELGHWVAIGGVTMAEGLEAAFTTARRLFPERRIQCFYAGCEADFLVLTQNPLEGVEALSAIELRIKGGALVEARADD